MKHVVCPNCQVAGLTTLVLLFVSLGIGLAQNDYHQGEQAPFSDWQGEPFEPLLTQADSLSIAEQRDGISESGYHPVSKGYWRLRTQYATRHTLIQVFNTEKKLVYEERLSGKYLKLNRRNTHLLDRLSERLLDNELIISSVKTSLLPEEITPALYGESAAADAPGASILAPLKTATFQVNTVLFTDGKLRVLFFNPLQCGVLLRVKNKAGEIVYEENSFLPKYNRTLDLMGLAAGEYTLLVRGRAEYVRSFRIQYAASQVVPQWLPQEKAANLSVAEHHK